MVRQVKPFTSRKTGGVFGGGKPPPDPPAPRRLDFERLVCDCIRRRLVIEFIYDGAQRMFAPWAFLETTHDKYVAYGYQLGINEGVRQFEVGRMQLLRATEQVYPPPPGFTSQNLNGRVICAIDHP